MSKDVGESLKYGDVVLALDLFPNRDHGMMNTFLQDTFEQHKNKLFKNCLSEIVPSGMVDVLISLSPIHPDTPVHSVTREERMSLITLLKHIPMEVNHLLGPDKSIVTSGGVDCTEIDFKTMHSRLWNNLSCIGDVLNIERPSGGYSLQICWSSGFVAGNNC